MLEALFYYGNFLISHKDQSFQNLSAMLYLRSFAFIIKNHRNDHGKRIRQKDMPRFASLYGWEMTRKSLQIFGELLDHWRKINWFSSLLVTAQCIRSPLTLCRLKSISYMIYSEKHYTSLRFIFVHQGLVFCLCEDFNCFFDGWFLCIFKFILSFSRIENGTPNY